MSKNVANWLAEIDKFISTASRQEKESIWIEVKEMNLNGPSVYSYFKDLFDNQPIDVNLDSSISVFDAGGPPLKPFNLNNETPKYSLESFFCIIAIWKSLSEPLFNYTGLQFQNLHSKKHLLNTLK